MLVYRDFAVAHESRVSPDVLAVMIVMPHPWVSQASLMRRHPREDRAYWKIAPRWSAAHASVEVLLAVQQEGPELRGLHRRMNHRQSLNHGPNRGLRHLHWDQNSDQKSRWRRSLNRLHLHRRLRV